MLRSKVTGGGGPSMEMLKNADDEIKEVGSKYAEWTIQDIEKLFALLQQAMENRQIEASNSLRSSAFRMTCADKARASITH